MTAAHKITEENTIVAQKTAILRWSSVTYKYLMELYKSENCKEAGVSQISGYRLQDPDDDQDISWMHSVETLKVLTPENLKSYPPYRSGVYLTTFTCETTMYMQWLVKRFQANHGKMHMNKVHSIEEMCEDFDIIINCSGLGAIELLQDKELQAVRGQVIRVRAPWIKSFYLFNNGTNYIIPTNSEVVLGGTRQLGNWDLQCSQEDKDAIWHEVCRFMPSIKKAEYIRDEVGLRPMRRKVRLEREDIPYKSKMVPVIHNYGHGGAGVALHWGCALDVVQLVREAVKDIQMKAKL